MKIILLPCFHVSQFFRRKSQNPYTGPKVPRWLGPLHHTLPWDFILQGPPAHSAQQWLTFCFCARGPRPTFRAFALAVHSGGIVPPRYPSPGLPFSFSSFAQMSSPLTSLFNTATLLRGEILTHFLFDLAPLPLSPLNRLLIFTYFLSPSIKRHVLWGIFLAVLSIVLFLAPIAVLHT